MAYEQHGSDFAGVLDIDFSLSIVSGRYALAQSLLRRLTTRTGTLIDDPSYGYDVRELIGRPVSDDEIQQAVATQCLADERVEGIEVIVTRNGEAIGIELIVTDGEGPFRLVTEISNVNVELLEIQEAA